MSRSPILGQLDRDVACAIALGLVESPTVFVTLESVRLHDKLMRPLGSETGWLNGTDPLDVATREFLTARRDQQVISSRAPRAGWAAASSVKDRDDANQRAIQARARALELLQTRGVLARAAGAGMRVVQSLP